jgi:hypothetical protein
MQRLHLVDVVLQKCQSNDFDLASPTQRFHELLERFAHHCTFQNQDLQRHNVTIELGMPTLDILQRGYIVHPHATCSVYPRRWP